MILIKNKKHREDSTSSRFYWVYQIDPSGYAGNVIKLVAQPNRGLFLWIRRALMLQNAERHYSHQGVAPFY